MSHGKGEDHRQGYAMGTYLYQEGEDLDFKEIDAIAQQVGEELEGRTIEDRTAFAQGIADGYTTAYERDHR